jgi:hypothetical protein
MAMDTFTHLPREISRRVFLHQTATALATIGFIPGEAGSVGSSSAADSRTGPPPADRERIRQLQKTSFPVRQLTFGPKFHWFGYYDKFQFDPSERYILGMEVDFDHRSPRPEDEVRIGMIDLGAGDRWIQLDKTSAWCWQQGCMLQWLPGSESEILWNDRGREGYVSHILDVRTGRKRTLPMPIYAVSPDGRWAVVPDFRRLADTRPGYGYVGLPDPFSDQSAPKESGIWWMDLTTGEHRLIVSLAEVAAIPFPQGDISSAKHWFNHLLVSPGGQRFVFLHRWRHPGASTWQTRMLTADSDGRNLRILDDNGVTSHFIWRDAEWILAWSLVEKPGGFFLFADRPERQVQLVYRERDGHCSFLPGGEWVLCDTYPDQNRLQHVYLYHVPTGEKVHLGSFYSPPAFTGEWRCDTHPRISRSGRWVCIDTPAGEHGRQMVLIDLAPLWQT